GRPLDELDLAVEDVRAVVIEPHDETSPDIEPMPLDLMDAVGDVRLPLDVLVLLRLDEGLRRRTLDADEDAPEARVRHGGHESRVLREVQGSLGVELEGPVVALLPALDHGKD